MRPVPPGDHIHIALCTVRSLALDDQPRRPHMPSRRFAGLEWSASNLSHSDCALTDNFPSVILIRMNFGEHVSIDRRQVVTNDSDRRIRVKNKIHSKYKTR